MNTPHLIIILFSLILYGFNGLSEEKLDLEKGLAYPELQVTPRASERLLMQAKEERSQRWSNHSAMILSSVGTLVTAFQSQDNPKDSTDRNYVDNNDWSTQAGYAIGGGWLIANIWLMAGYEPYRTGYKKVKSMPTGNKRETLARERIAEEALYQPARLGTKLVWFSAISNLSASLYMMSYGDDQARITAAVSSLLAMAPIFFPYDWIDTANQHKMYKKKIYGPVAGIQLLNAAPEKSPIAGMGFTLSF